METMKHMATLLLTIAGVYIVILALMYLFQNQLLFMPSSQMVQTPAGGEDVWIETEDGVTLHGWYFSHADSEWVIVLSHGNAGNISGRIDIAEMLLQSGASVLMYDYRGFGQSGGRPSEKGLYKDIEAVVRFLAEVKGYPESRMVMYGRSLGGAVAAYAAGRFDIGGLVLDSAFKNLETMVREVYPFVPGWLAKYEFPTDQYVSNLDGLPVMVMHSREDEIIGFHHGRDLFRLLDDPKRFVQLSGGHNDNFFSSGNLIAESWASFLEQLENSPNAGVPE